MPDNSFSSDVNLTVVRHEAAPGEKIRWTAANGPDHSVTFLSDEDDCPPIGYEVSVRVRWKAPPGGRAD